MRKKCGWFETDEHMPPIPPGGTMWQIWGLIEHDGEEDTVGHVKVVGGKGWNGPRRVSGEKGETGLQGPAGLRGVSGLPGVTQHTLYCLGTYGKEKSEYYFDHYDAYSDTNENKMGDGYFGSKDYQNKFVENLTPLGWYEYKDMPYSDIIRVANDAEFNAAVSPEAQNDGRVVCYTHVETTQKSGSTFSQKKYQYFLVNRGGGYTRLTDLLDEKDNEEFAIYMVYPR